MRISVRPLQKVPRYSAEHMLTTKVSPGEATTPQFCVLVVSPAVLEAEKDGQNCCVVGLGVGGVDGDGLGRRVGSGVGTGVGGVTGLGEGSDDGEAVGRADGRGEGCMVGGYVTIASAAPDTASLPTQLVDPRHPSLTTYVCVGVPAGTVYCTWAQVFPLLMHTAGGKDPVPVSSYTTSTPVAVYMRSAVMPLHTAPGYRAWQREAVKVTPAFAVMPQVLTAVVSALVLSASNTVQ